MDYRKKILFVSHLSFLNGAEKSLYTLIKGLQNQGDFFLVMMAPCAGPLVEKVKDMNVPVVVSKYFFWTGSRKKCFILRIVRVLLNVLATLVLYKKIKNYKFDMIYSNSLVVPVGAVLAKLLKIPHIWHAREFVFEDFNGQYDLGEKISMALVNFLSENIVCNSKAVEKKLLSYKHWKKPTRVIYNGFDFSDTEQIDPQKKYDQCIGSIKGINLLIAGSINSGKGQEDAIRAISILIKKGCLVNLLIAGTGNKNHIRYLKSIAEDTQVSRRIHFLGYVDNIASLYKVSAITLICSRNEAFGRTAIESLSHGTPVIATCRGGVPEIINDNVTGLLYEPENFTDLSDRIEKLLLDRVLYERLASHGQTYVYNYFGKNRYVKQIKTVLKEYL